MKNRATLHGLAEHFFETDNVLFLSVCVILHFLLK